MFFFFQVIEIDWAITQANSVSRSNLLILIDLIFIKCLKLQNLELTVTNASLGGAL